MKLDILAIMAHPDDAELSCSGTLAKAAAEGKKVGILDLTRGELGTRGTPELRLEEAASAAKILKLRVRDNMEFADGFFLNDKHHQLKLVQKIRHYQPDLLITNAENDRHPDHGRASNLVEEACFLSGLRQIPTLYEGLEQQEWRPKRIYHIIQSIYAKPDVIVDVSDFWETKKESIKAFSSQFFVPEQKDKEKKEEPETYISSERFWHFLEARSREFGQAIQCQHGEGFTARHQLGVKSLNDLI